MTEVKPKGRYTAADLARRANVSVRTVRFYIQEGLVDPPLGRGPGAHFGERHLHQLLRARSMQALGFDIATIRQYADELEKILADRGLTLENAGRLWAAYALSGLPDRMTDPEPEDDAADDADDELDEELDADSAVRIPMAPGVELLVRPDVKLPTPRKLVELAMMIRRLFKAA